MKIAYGKFAPLILAGIVGYPSIANSSSCYDCAPQCVPAARVFSGVNVPRVNFAKDVPGVVARTPGFVVNQTPPTGRKSYVVLSLGKAGHAVAVIRSEKVATGRWSLLIAHSNSDCRCTSELAKAEFGDGKIKFLSGLLRGKAIPILGGFITAKG